MNGSRRVARVLIDSPLPQLDRLFDYSIPDALARDARPGVRVRVPLRSAGRVADGFLVEVADAGGYPGALSELESVVSAVPVLAPEVWALARRVSDRAAGGASDVVRLAVPKRQVRVEKAWLAGELTVPDGAIHPVDAPDYAAGRIGAAVAAGERLAVDAVPRVVPLSGDRWVGHWAVTMASAATHALASGGTAILVVPDYRDQEQLLAALAAVLPPERIVRLDARQPNPERYRALLRCLGDTPLVVVGNRSAVYAPARRLALIEIWDDGDPLHAEPLAPYVHARDAALVRQEQQGGALLFVGHARSTEVERLVEVGWAGELGPARAVLPKVVPTAQQAAQDRLAAQARIPSAAWRAARAALEHGPVLVQVARPGYAPKLTCQDCGQAARCTRCGGPLGLKTARSAPACGWCGALAVDWRCANCEGTRLRLVGQGATRTAEDLGRAFPGVRVIIADGERPILTVGAEPALVIATRGAEPVAAGGYRAVLLLDGERMLARESLRVAEDCLRWWANAVALAAPGATSMLVGVGGALASALATWRLGSYVRGELADRRVLRLPPAVRIATISGTPEAVEHALTAVRSIEHGTEHVDVLGPVEIDGALVRAIVRLDYSIGSAVANALRAEVVTAAANRRRRAAGSSGRAPLPTLRVRFDDAEPLVE